MILASDIKPGMALHLDGKLYKVLEVVRHTGSGQMHGFIELKLKDMRFGHLADRRFKNFDRLDDVELAKRQMEYLYADTDALFFMDPDTFEQVGIPKTAAGGAEKFIKEGGKVTIEMLDGEAVSMDFPKVVELRVASTGPGIRGGQDNTMKSAVLENGVEVLVPHFVETGDMVRVDAEKSKYIDRVTTKRA
jgi:elongation factor P